MRTDFRLGGRAAQPWRSAGISAGIRHRNGEKGYRFKTQREGVRAQIQHLKAYASSKKLNYDCIDPRFAKVKRGCAPCVEDLGGLWAYPGYDTKKYKTFKMAQKKRDTYGHTILRHYRNILKTERIPKKIPK